MIRVHALCIPATCGACEVRKDSHGSNSPSIGPSDNLLPNFYNGIFVSSITIASGNGRPASLSICSCSFFFFFVLVLFSFLMYLKAGLVMV